MHVLVDSIVIQIFYVLWTIVIPILLYILFLRHMFLFLLSRCANAELMINLCVTCEETATHFQGIFHSPLSVWWFYFPASLLTQDILVSLLTLLLCVWGGLATVLPLCFLPQYTFFPEVSLFLSGMLLKLYSSLQFLRSESLLCALAPMSPFLDPVPLLPCKLHDECKVKS